jgi:hypothetical protein
VTGVLLVTMSGQAQAAGEYWYRNAKTQKCLSVLSVGSKTTVQQGSCAEPALSRWTNYNYDSAGKHHQIQNVWTGQCLDGDLQGNVYLSTCNETDPGQFWEYSSFGHVHHKYSYKVLTAWNDGSVSLASQASGTTNYDTWIKQIWDGLY